MASLPSLFFVALSCYTKEIHIRDTCLPDVFHSGGHIYIFFPFSTKALSSPKDEKHMEKKAVNLSVSSLWL